MTRISATLDRTAAELARLEGDVRQANDAAKAAPRWTPDKVLPVALSGSALAVSLFFAAYTAIYTRRKDRKARNQSISDEYLLRKIVSPSVIEPLLKWMLDVTNSIPPDCGDQNFSYSAAQTYRSTFQQGMVTHRGNLVMLKQLDPQIFDAANQRLDSIEDGVLVYCGSNVSGALNADGSPSHPRGPLVSEIQTHMRAILGEILAYQQRLS